MGLLAADLERLRSHMNAPVARISKTASMAKPEPVETLRSALELYAGAAQATEKTAGDDEHKRLWSLHEQAEAAYRNAVKLGKRVEASAVLDKFAGWSYLKGQPGEQGDLHPLPAPEEK
jgi:hypothetical protein